MSRYKCPGCEVEWSTENMAPICGSCFFSLQRKVRDQTMQTSPLPCPHRAGVTHRASRCVYCELDASEQRIRDLKQEVERLKIDPQERIMMEMTLDSREEKIRGFTALLAECAEDFKNCIGHLDSGCAPPKKTRLAWAEVLATIKSNEAVAKVLENRQGRR